MKSNAVAQRWNGSEIKVVVSKWWIRRKQIEGKRSGRRKQEKTYSLGRLQNGSHSNGLLEKQVIGMHFWRKLETRVVQLERGEWLLEFEGLFGLIKKRETRLRNRRKRIKSRGRWIHSFHSSTSQNCSSLLSFHALYISINSTFSLTIFFFFSFFWSFEIKINAIQTYLYDCRSVKTLYKGPTLHCSTTKTCYSIPLSIFLFFFLVFYHLTTSSLKLKLIIQFHVNWVHVHFLFNLCYLYFSVFSFILNFLIYSFSLKYYRIKKNYYK